jgi:hypothetical protein
LRSATSLGGDIRPASLSSQGRDFDLSRRGGNDGKRGDHVIVAPPYSSQPHHIEMIVEHLEQSINQALTSVHIAAA